MALLFLKEIFMSLRTKTAFLTAWALALALVTGCSDNRRQEAVRAKVDYDVRHTMGKWVLSFSLAPNNNEADIVLPSPGVNGRTAYHVCLQKSSTCTDRVERSSERLVQVYDNGSSGYWRGFWASMLINDGDMLQSVLWGKTWEAVSRGPRSELRPVIEEKGEGATCSPEQRAAIDQLRGFVQRALLPTPIN
jgi:hypothetical protein